MMRPGICFVHMPRHPPARHKYRLGIQHHHFVPHIEFRFVTACPEAKPPTVCASTSIWPCFSSTIFTSASTLVSSVTSATPAVPPNSCNFRQIGFFAPHQHQRRALFGELARHHLPDIPVRTRYHNNLAVKFARHRNLLLKILKECSGWTDHSINTLQACNLVLRRYRGGCNAFSLAAAKPGSARQ